MTTIDTLPKSFLVRRPAMDDLEAVYDVMVACGIEEDGSVDFPQDEIRTVWEMPGFNLATDAWVVLSPEGRIVGYADIEDTAHARIFSFVRVHPEYRGRGISTYLLGQVEQRAREHIPLARPEVRVTLSVQCSHANAAAGPLLARAGFTRERHHWGMEITMDEPPRAPQWPEGITVRTFALGQDERTTFNGTEDAFRDHWGYMPWNYEQWEHSTIKREDFDPTLWFLAFAGNELAGCSLCEYNMTMGWVHQLAVRRPWRRKGLAMALLLHSFAEFYRRGTRAVGLGVDAQSLTGATRLYERAGMHIARQYDTYLKELRAGEELATQALGE
ncbi:MAG: GNAT family N-acetyltransferase [Ktedonobacteraceae bacterium]|nr:GNAT family N-acetyltransferase [Ktedonobacteraceae bacterium]